MPLTWPCSQKHKQRAALDPISAERFALKRNERNRKRIRGARDADVDAERLKPGRAADAAETALPAPEELRCLNSRKNILYDRQGRVLLAVFRRCTPHNKLTAAHVAEVFAALKELRATPGYENLFAWDGSREWKSFHAGVWALYAAHSTQSFHSDCVLFSSYQELSYLIKGTERPAMLQFLARLRPVAEIMKDLVEKFFPDVYALLKPVADSIPEQYRCGLWAAVAINLGASGSHF